MLCPQAGRVVRVHMWCRFYRSPTASWNLEERDKLFLSRCIAIMWVLFFISELCHPCIGLVVNDKKAEALFRPSFESLLYHYLCNWVWKKWGLKKSHCKKNWLCNRILVVLVLTGEMLSSRFVLIPKGIPVLLVHCQLSDFVLRMLDSEEHMSCLSTFKIYLVPVQVDWQIL